MLRSIRARISVLACLLMLLSSLSAIHTPAHAAVLGDDYPSNLKSAPSGSTDPWGFFVRNCTSFVAWRMNNANDIAFTNTMGGGRWSNASNWDDNARSLGYRVDNSPAIGSVAHRPTGNHVAWVAEVHGDGTITIEEYNWEYSGRYNARRVTTSGWQFIHIRDITSTTQATMPGNSWLLSNYMNGDGHQIEFSYGRPGDVALVGDWDGDGVSTPGVFRDGYWYITNDVEGGTAQISFGFGRSGDTPLVGDWDGDGADTFGVRRGSTWILSNRRENPTQQLNFSYGRSDDIPLVGDWDGNGYDSIGVKRGNYFYLSNYLDSRSHQIGFGYGRSTDLPLVGDWDGNSTDTIALFRSGDWYFTNSPTASATHFSFSYGRSSDFPVGGNWDGLGGDNIGVVR